MPKKPDFGDFNLGPTFSPDQVHAIVNLFEGLSWFQGDFCDPIGALRGFDFS